MKRNGTVLIGRIFKITFQSTGIYAVLAPLYYLIEGLFPAVETMVYAMLFDGAAAWITGGHTGENGKQLWIMAGILVVLSLFRGGLNVIGSIAINIGIYERLPAFLNQKLAQKIPDGLQEKLDAAFSKAFFLVFDKGTGIIEKTYKREDLEHGYKVNAYSAEIRENKNTLRTFKKGAAASSRKNLLLSTAEGVGLGVLGIGLPDIPLFTGMILKSIYEVALHYGYAYDIEEERYFILKLIQVSLLYGEELVQENQKTDLFMEMKKLPEGYDMKKQVKDTSSMLSGELLYMKFLQGIPVVGAAGGIYDTVYLQRIMKYVKIKYQKRFLLDKARKRLP